MRHHIQTLKAGLGAAALVGLATTGGCAAAAGDMGSAFATAAGIPQMDAFLPSREAVPEGQAMAIDGDYTISTIGKRIRFEGGRAYAIDPWLHGFSLKVRPGMVVIRDITKTGDGTYAGEDLPLMGKATFRVAGSGAMDVQVAGALGPANYQLIPVAGSALPAPIQPDPIGDGGGDDLDGCENFDLDADGNIVCAD